VQLCVVSIKMIADVVFLQDMLEWMHVDAKQQGTENGSLRNAAGDSTTFLYRRIAASYRAVSDMPVGVYSNCIRISFVINILILVKITTHSV